MFQVGVGFSISFQKQLPEEFFSPILNFSEETRVPDYRTTQMDKSSSRCLEVQDRKDSTQRSKKNRVYCKCFVANRPAVIFFPNSACCHKHDFVVI